jgi:predicted DNA-binding protein (MmcQ/YjbR family)
MVTEEEMAAWALEYPEVSQSPHFEKTSFRVKKKIFATLDIQRRRATLKLTEIDQSVFSDYDRTTVYPVPGTWGKQGWTCFELKKVRKSLFRDALKTAYTTVAPKSLIEQLKQG